MNFENCNGTIHNIVKGDSLYSISRQYGVPLGLLLKANPYADVYNLQIGDEICIPINIPNLFIPRRVEEEISMPQPNFRMPENYPTSQPASMNQPTMTPTMGTTPQPTMTPTMGTTPQPTTIPQMGTTPQSSTTPTMGTTPGATPRFSFGAPMTGTMPGTTTGMPTTGTMPRTTTGMPTQGTMPGTTTGMPTTGMPTQGTMPGTTTGMPTQGTTPRTTTGMPTQGTTPRTTTGMPNIGTMPGTTTGMPTTGTAPRTTISTPTTGTTPSSSTSMQSFYEMPYNVSSKNMPTSGKSFQMIAYVVKENDSLQKILDSFDIDIEDLFRYNDLGDIMLRPGSTINIPKKSDD